MSRISLQAEGILDVTIIPNIFIDEFMPSANGAYVKVYLYLLRSLQSASIDISISSIADHLDNTEKDIIRALNYWEKMNLLTLVCNSQKEVTEIHLLTSNHSDNKNQIKANTQMKANNNPIKAVEYQSDEVAVSTESMPATRQSYPNEKITELTNNDNFKSAMYEVEMYLERPLKPMDTQLILYLHEELNFSYELITYLYEYCVSKGKKNASYIEAVALTWAEEGIDTAEKARETIAAYNEHFIAVNKAFGLNRSPGQIERQYIKKWVEVYHFTDTILTEACNRTILRTQKPDFKYTDKILETWHKKGAKNLEDIARLDEEFSRGNKSHTEQKSAPMTKPSNNKFNQYPQRNYSSKDYAELERKLLNKGL